MATPKEGRSLVLALTVGVVVGVVVGSFTGDFGVWIPIGAGTGGAVGLVLSNPKRG